MFFGKVYEAAAAELAVDAIVPDSRPSGVARRNRFSESHGNADSDLGAEDERPLVITLPSVALERQRMMQLGQGAR